MKSFLFNIKSLSRVCVIVSKFFLIKGSEDPDFVVLMLIKVKSIFLSMSKTLAENQVT